MLRLLRSVLASVSVVLLAAGYFASMFASLQGDVTAYAQKMDAPPIRYLALLLLLAAVGSCFLGERGNDP